MEAPPKSSRPDRPERLREQVRERFGPSEAPICVAQAPGRVNLLGGHTDYNAGLVLPATIDRTVQAALRRRPGETASNATESGDTVRLHSVNFDETVEYAAGDVDPSALPGWARYVAGVAEELRRQGHAVGGFEAAFEGDVPLGAGLSSSAALEVAAAVGLGELFSLELGAAETARLCQRVEQEYVGVECGIMDQFASRLGRAGHALFLDCRSLDHEHVPLQLAEREAALIVADSGVRRELASSKYNERQEECHRAAALLREQTGEAVETLRDATPEMVRAHRHALPEPLGKRARHVATENQRVLEGARRHLAGGDLEALGRLMYASHASLAGDYEVSSPELDALVEAARATGGVFGARMTGAGFGGCTITLAPETAVEAFTEEARRRFDGRFDDRTPTFYVISENVEAGVMEAPMQSE